MSPGMVRWLVVGFFLTSCLQSSQESSTIDKGKEPDGPAVERWLTYADQSHLLTRATDLAFSTGPKTEPAISVDTAKQYQSVDGFGYTLTGGSAWLMNEKLMASARAALLRELFLGGDEGIGISYLRISIGASDLDDQVFSYNDLSPGETDVTLSKFSIEPDRAHLIPILKEILTLNPDIRIMGSPWSAPAWMKTNEAVKGGSLKPEYYDAYANYFVKYVQAMEEEGIPIDAVTVQNEPEHPGNTPSMTMTSAEQNVFVRDHLGPAFASAGIETKIVIYDHNCDHPEYPIAILNDPVTRTMVDGTAFHLYLGDVSALSTVHNAHPDKNIYFTEQWTSGEGDFGGDLRWHVKNLIVGAPRNWSRTVLEWNLASDENFEPHTDDGGCTLCQGALTINSLTGAVTRNVSYYIIAHASKFVPAGSVRVQSNIVNNLHNVAYLTPEGKTVLIVLNDNDSDTAFNIHAGDYTTATSLPSGAVATYVWQ